MHDVFKDFYLKIMMTDKDVKIPTRAYSSDAGLDFYAPKDIYIPALEDVKIDLCVRVEFPEGFAMIFKEKSGIAVKYNSSVGAAVVDSSYRGNVHLHLFNHHRYEHHKIPKDTKVIQAIFVPVWTGNPEIVDYISQDTDRGIGGFGSTSNK